jgi:hypothetical protein
MICLLANIFPEDAPIVLPLLIVTILKQLRSTILRLMNPFNDEIEADPTNHYAFTNAKLKNTLP